MGVFDIAADLLQQGEQWTVGVARELTGACAVLTVGHQTRVALVRALAAVGTTDVCKCNTTVRLYMHVQPDCGVALADISGANSSQGSDKCYPCLMADGQYCTRTGQLARNSHRPLLSLLQEVCRNVKHPHNGQSLMCHVNRPILVLPH